MFGYQPLQPFGGNPYQDQLARMQMQPQSVTRVSGIDSARQLRLPPNSSMFALDYDDQHIYAVFTDGAGVVTAKPYLLKACDEPQAAGGRVAALEAPLAAGAVVHVEAQPPQAAIGLGGAFEPDYRAFAFGLRHAPSFPRSYAFASTPSFMRSLNSSHSPSIHR